MSDLLSNTVHLLSVADEPRHVIAKNAGVGYEWLAKFAQGRIPDPGVSRVQRLHDYLTRQQESAA